MLLYESLLQAANEQPDLVALEFRGMKIPMALLADSARQVAVGLQSAGVRPGDTVAVMLPNIPQFVAAHYGVLMAGAVFVPLNVMLTGPEIEYIVTDSNVRVIITFEMFLDQVRAGLANVKNPPQVFAIGENLGGYRSFAELMKLDPEFEPVRPDPDATCMMLYTSGTTGKPKGAQISNRNVVSQIEMMDSVVEFCAEDRALCVLPLFHAFALQAVLNASIRRRTTVVLHVRFELEECVRSLEEDNITWFAGVPTMYFFIMKHPRISELKFPALKHCVTGGAAMPVDVLAQWEKRFGIPIHEGYGLTETTVCSSMNREGKRKVGSVGVPLDGVEMRVVDDDGAEVPTGEVGEIIIRGPNVMKGYLNKPADNAAALREGWFFSGDLGYKDADGYFFIVDRKKDMIIKGGLNIYPREIEEVIYQLPQVAEAAVVGVYDEAKGEHVRAMISLKPNATLTAEDVDRHLRANLAKYKLPHGYAFIAELPKGPTGKILKREIRDKWKQYAGETVTPVVNDS